MATDCSEVTAKREEAARLFADYVRALESQCTPEPSTRYHDTAPTQTRPGYTVSPKPDSRFAVRQSIVTTLKNFDSAALTAAVESLFRNDTNFMGFFSSQNAPKEECGRYPISLGVSLLYGGYPTGPDTTYLEVVFKTARYLDDQDLAFLKRGVARKFSEVSSVAVSADRVSVDLESFTDQAPPDIVMRVKAPDCKANPKTK